MIVADGTFTGGAFPSTADLIWLQNVEGTFKRPDDSLALLAAVNTSDALEYAPELSADGLELYFTRFTPSWLLILSDPPAIYVAKRTSTADSFSTPEYIKAMEGFVEAPTLSPDGRSLYFHKKVGNRHEIWRVTR
jgi:hypothetical protein